MRKLSVKRRINEDWLQWIYCDNDLEISVNRLTKNAVILSLSHIEPQIGYCFEGEFDFEAAGKWYRFKKGDSYKIISNIKHGAKILETIIALDLKYRSIKKETNLIKTDLLKYNFYEDEDVRIKLYLDRESLEAAEICNENGVDTYIIYMENPESNNLDLEREALEKYQIYSVSDAGEEIRTLAPDL